MSFDPYLSGMYDAASQLATHVVHRSKDLLSAGHAINDALRTPDDVAARRERIREVAIAALGGLPEAGGAPVAQIVGRVAADGYTIEKIVLEPSPGVVVTGNVYVPDGITEPAGGVLFCCGHLELGKAAQPYQAACIRLARNGLVALAIDPIGQGERKSYLDADGSERVPCNNVEHTYAGVQCWWVGDSIARYFVHEARRAIDYLTTRDDVDPHRIGVVGNSGGGTLISWLMMVEPRLAAAAPGCYVTDRLAVLLTGRSQDAEQHILAGISRGVDHDDFLIAMAPRPVMVLSANYDFFPIEGAIRTVRRARRAYRILGVEDRLEHVRVDKGHGFHPDLARAATRFMVRHLNDKSNPVIDDQSPDAPPTETLWCTRTGQVLFDRPGSRRVFDLNLQRHRELTKAYRQRSGEDRARGAKAWLADRVHAHRRPPEAFYPRWFPPSTSDDEMLVARQVFWWSEVDLLGAGVLVQPANSDFTSLVIALFDHGTESIDEHSDWLAAAAARQRAVLAVDVRGTGALAPNPLNPHPVELNHGTMYKLMTSLFWLDDSLAAGRAFDILRAVEFVRTDPEIGLESRPVSLYGSGIGAFHGYLAAALEPAITDVELADLPLDPADVVRHRYYTGEEQWQCVIPGMATHAPMNDIHPYVKERELIVQ